MVLTENVEAPEPMFLYTAVKVQPGAGVGVRPRTSTVALARTGSLPNTRSEFASEGMLEGPVLQVASTDMKPAVCPVLPNICAVRITIAAVPVTGTVTDGPVSAQPVGGVMQVRRGP